MDIEKVYVDAMAYALEGEDATKAIDNQMKREQREVVKKELLPIKMNDIGVPHEVRFAGVTDEMEYKEREEITDKNNIAYTKEQYVKMGVTIVKQYDDVFYLVKLPEGWEIKPTDHSMWTEVFDDKGRKRMNYFYKGSFYDREAFVNFLIRYSYNAIPFDNYESDADYEIRKVRPWYGVVYDCGKVIFKTAGEVSPDGSVPVWDIQDNQKKIALDYISKHFPNWEDINSYWD